MSNVIKAWNIESSADFSLDGPVGQVYSMIVANEMLIAGAQGGICPVICLAVGGNMLYSGSMDNTIRRSCFSDVANLYLLLLLKPGLKYALKKGFKHIRVHEDSMLMCMQMVKWKRKVTSRLNVKRQVCNVFYDDKRTIARRVWTCHRSRESGYHICENGYKSNFQNFKNGYQSRKNGYRSNEGGYQSSENG
ncbi:hypothetical protein Dsin_023544 [Dipteronia sinensis]|uniref:RNase H type-1 domain-containing protein n=1 Tax=Dipteronia sinensis TaxID=43782 RepID=A0AAE0A4M5_9ROSI|nr:hypothetical protein Dsin_023544 [Dipteronia sinensis]